MAESLNVPLPEISVEKFERSWTRFLVVAQAKEWSEAKQVKVVPTLLSGKLFDLYLDLADDEKGSMRELKEALMKRAGAIDNPLVAACDFQSRIQGPSEKSSEFIADLKKKFKQAYQGEAVTSTVLLQKALTGLRPEIGKQVLLTSGQPDSLEDLSEKAMAVEQALNFCKESVPETEEVFAVKPSVNDVNHAESKLSKLEALVENMAQKLETLEMKLKDQKETSRSTYQKSRPGPRVRFVRCFKCGGIGHRQFDAECPLNEREPTPPATGVGSRRA